MLGLLLMKPGWRERLIAAVDADGRADSAISIAAKNGVNFVNQLRNDKKDPGITRVLRLAAELKLSLTHLFFGGDASVEDDEFLLILRESSSEEREALKDLIKAVQARQRAKGP
jgi:transcriptional regulator with XRE-family HTH domain